MLWEKIQTASKSLSLRMTLWYAIIFSLSSMLLLYVFYSRIAIITMGQIDQELVEEFNEFNEAMAQEGFENVKTLLAEKQNEDSGQGVFFRLLTTDGGVLAASNMMDIDRFNIATQMTETARMSSAYQFQTAASPDYDYGFRILTGLIGSECVIQIGMSLEENETYLSIFRGMMLYAIPPVVVMAAFIGWLMARKAMAGVEEVTQTARLVSKGSYEKRVEITKHSAEIDQLAGAFNHMLDRLQVLIKTIRELNDNIAHELRSPLARIRGSAEMTLLGNDNQSRYKEMAASIIEECDFLSDMINMMFEITESEAGIAEIQSVYFDLNDLISGVCELFRTVAEQKNIKIHQFLPEKTLIKGDPKKLQIVAANLLENAVKYTPAGGQVRITVELNRHQAVIDIEDTGIGIPEKDLPFIFNRFYRVDKNRSREGIGLGLSLAKAIVESLAGTIEVTSVINLGSSFRIILPREIP